MKGENRAEVHLKVKMNHVLFLLGSGHRFPAGWTICVAKSEYGCNYFDSCSLLNTDYYVDLNWAALTGICNLFYLILTRSTLVGVVRFKNPPVS